MSFLDSMRKYLGLPVERRLQALGIRLQGRSSRSQLSLLEPEKPSDPLIVDMDLYQKLWIDYSNHPLSKVTSHDFWYPGRDAKNPVKDIDLKRFRGDNAYVWQLKSIDVTRLAISALYTETCDPHGVLSRTREDGDFGVQCIRLNDRLWSRDLIDSVLEINFLIDHLPTGSLDSMRIIDVGAGYGRLLHRLADATENSQLYGADGVALSTVISKAYVDYLKQDSRISILTLAQVDAYSDGFDLATNVHSFSEMPLTIVEGWLDWLEKRGVKYLFVVPNKSGPSLNDGTNFMPQVLQRGFELVATRPKFEDPLIGKLAFYPSTYYLFERH
jgi:SAM-dependent methyltransferase